MDIKRLILLLIGLGIIGGMILKIGIKEVYNALLGADFHLLILAFFIYLFVVLIKSLRWVILFRSVNPLNACKVYFIGQAMNEIAPIGSGELTRAYIAKDRFEIFAGETIASATIERAADTSFIVGVCGMFILFHGYEGWMGIIVPAGILLALLLIILKPNLLDWIDFIPRKAGKIGKKISDSIEVFKETIFTYHERKNTIFFCIFLTILAWVIESGGHSVLLESLGYNVFFLEILGIAATSWVIGTFSFLPGGLGAREAVFAFLLGISGVPFSVGLSTALIYRGMTYLLLGTGAMLSILSFKS
ncbi:MAG: lysylphosphatidylglycerol synthase transmembrane domain-containing protein [Candidatus Syntropharchaeia archaeon]